MSYPIEMSLSTRCTCEDERGGMMDCGGDCFTADAEYLAELSATWVAQNPSDHGYLIAGEGMGWTKASGTRDWDGREPLHEAIGVRGEWQQHYHFAATEIQITQSHHDAMGERYTVRAKTSDEE
jgi:hypothetical protein